MLSRLLCRHGRLIFLAYLLCFLLLVSQQRSIYALPALCAVAVLGWYLNQRRYRLITDTPRSRLSSAALGRVELHGRAYCHPHAVNYSPLSARRCVWYRCWRLEDENRQSLPFLRAWLGQPDYGMHSETSSDSFLLQDGEQQAIVLPEGAEVLPSHQHSWQEEGAQLTEEWIEEGELLYISARLEPLAQRSGTLDVRLDIGQKLAEWKQDRHRLLQRFDQNRDGQLDQQEWQAARAAAQVEVEQQLQEQAQSGPNLLLQQSNDGLPFLITTLTPQASANLFRRLAWLHAGAALISLVLWLYSL
ncbi:hypothetical protein HZU77_013050 [Neisseriaceae bacterium TC5R-5]|nr:hypothetical protein [Neisseriaceae bacterium TC5R-5]